MGLIGRTINNFIGNRKKKQFLKTLESINQDSFVKEIDENRTEVNFCHHGHLGDVIYAIPCMLALSKGKPINLFLNTNVKNTYHGSLKHHSATNISEASVQFLKPLIEAQQQFSICKSLENEVYDYNLNNIHQFPFNLKVGNIVRWYFLTYGVSFDTTRPWLTVQANHKLEDCILIARSFRYRSPGISYSFLSKYSNLYFVGLEDEYLEMKNCIPNLQYLKVKTALELAEAIAGCKLFIGNQSFPFALAEALKAKRVLEVDFLTPNVIVDGANGFDFCYQPQFEKIIKNILED
jgi:hypothetical protein